MEKLTTELDRVIAENAYYKKQESKVQDDCDEIHETSKKFYKELKECKLKLKSSQKNLKEATSEIAKYKIQLDKYKKVVEDLDSNHESRPWLQCYAEKAKLKYQDVPFNTYKSPKKMNQYGSVSKSSPSKTAKSQVVPFK